MLLISPHVFCWKVMFSVVFVCLMGRCSCGTTIHDAIGQSQVAWRLSPRGPLQTCSLGSPPNIFTYLTYVYSPYIHWQAGAWLSTGRLSCVSSLKLRLLVVIFLLQPTHTIAFSQSNRSIICKNHVLNFFKECSHSEASIKPNDPFSCFLDKCCIPLWKTFTAALILMAWEFLSKIWTIGDLDD